MNDKQDDGEMSPLREAAVQMHELYVELKDAGFSRGEAMELMGRVMSSMFIQQQGQGPVE